MIAWLAGRWLAPLPAAVLSSALALPLCWAALYAHPQALLAPELITLMRNRAGDSALLAGLCRLIRVTRA